MKKTALFPGSFDPVTIGHVDIVNRSLSLFDNIVIGIGVNSSKKSMYSIEKRKGWLGKVFEDKEKVSVQQYEGLTVDFCNEIGAMFILRGLRTSADFEFERAIAQMNRSMHGDIETVFILSSPGLSAVSSTIVREIIKNGGEASKFVPAGIDLSLG
ncbi:MAG TPA: pantetheine-phosphate adenylyltransferase [Flavobacteriales bacterium]|nr:pantetheine-phosphate adenylyltransferase [Flavobacteriales bacterium]HIO67750.1 pantetheine-phosphate adenylyltransferase [Flavobacteriales bacterium]